MLTVGTQLGLHDVVVSLGARGMGKSIWRDPRDRAGLSRSALPRALFDISPLQYVVATLPSVNDDVSPDGQKFVFIQASGENRIPPLAVVLNSPAEIRRLTEK